MRHKGLSLLAISKMRSTEHTEHGAHGVRSSRKTKIFYNKIHCLLLQIFVIINKDFSRLHVGEVRKLDFKTETHMQNCQKP